MEKERHLKDSLEALSIMKMRITFIITQKFVTFVEKVMETCNYRNINDAFDAIID